MIETSPRLVRVALLGAVLAALAAIPSELVASLPTICLWRTLFDVECPGCGLTRALSTLLHGQLAAALAFNRGIVLVLPGMVAILVRDLHALCCADALEDHPA